MKVVITHTDLRIYWPSRILALQQALESRGDELYTVEIAGAGSPYAFSGNGGSALIRNWTCLFPETRMEDLPAARASRLLRAKLDELNPDVIMAGSIAYPSGATAVRWAKAHHRSVIIFDDIRPEDVPRNPMINYIKKLIYEQVDAILCPASAWTDAFLHWNFRSEQLFFGVDVVDNVFWGTRDPAENMHGWSDPFFLAVGRLIPAKNFFFLLQVYEQYQASMTYRDPLPLIIVGDGPQREMMENYIREKKLKQVYIFPFADPKQLRAFYHHAAALVLPSKAETWGLVVNEAMAAGLPVLVSKACGCASVLVREEINGYTFSPDKPHQLLDLLVSFTEKPPAERVAMGKASRQIIQPWGLDQFVKGSLRAIDYVLMNRKICRSVQARFVLKSWKGRYRPI